jgi:hypothetical protein
VDGGTQKNEEASSEQRDVADAGGPRVEVTLLDLDWWCARSGMIADSQWQPADSSGLFPPFSSDEGDVDANNYETKRVDFVSTSNTKAFCVWLRLVSKFGVSKFTVATL